MGNQCCLAEGAPKWVTWPIGNVRCVEVLTLSRSGSIRITTSSAMRVARDGIVNGSKTSEGPGYLASGSKAKVLNPVLLIFGVGIDGHPKAYVGKFGFHHIFKVTTRISPARHHSQNRFLSSRDVLGHHGPSPCIPPFISCALHSLSRCRSIFSFVRQKILLSKSGGIFL